MAKNHKDLGWYLMHYGALTLIVGSWYAWIHPPAAGTSVISMFIELGVVLTGADLIVHRIIGD